MTTEDLGSMGTSINSVAGFADGLSAADRAVLDFGDQLDHGRAARQLG